jgi:hypothetical protein
MTMPKPISIEPAFPNITLWVNDCGVVEIGYDPNTESFIRAIDEGGMVWSGKNHYENLDDALKDLESGLGHVLVGVGLSGVASSRRKTTPKPPSLKKAPEKRAKVASQPPLPKQVRKLEQIAEAIRGNEHVQITRLTVIKKLCENPQAAGAFALFLAQQAQRRLREKKGNDRYRELVGRAVREMKPYLDDPTEDSRKRLRSLLVQFEAEQNEYVSIGWNAVRNIKNFDLLTVEHTLRTILNWDEAPHWLYQAARDYVGGSIVFEKKSIPQLQEIVQFWRRHFSAKR